MLQPYYPPKAPPKTLLFTGTGVVQGSWLPVRNALLRYFKEIPEGEENLAFATEIYKMRQVAAAYQGGLKLVGYNPFEYIDIKISFSGFYKKYNDIKKEIAVQLTKATEEKQLTLRPLMQKINNRWLRNSDSKLIVTTNWDLMLETYFTDCVVYHLHGDITDHQTLYLPSEHSWESYHQIRHKTRHSEAREKILHGNWLATGVETLIITGLSLSPLDAEINSFLASACNSGRRKIPRAIIIDPFPEIVMSRLKFHTLNTIGEIILFKPEEV